MVGACCAALPGSSLTSAEALHVLNQGSYSDPKMSVFVRVSCHATYALPSARTDRASACGAAVWSLTTVLVVHVALPATSRDILILAGAVRSSIHRTVTFPAASTPIRGLCCEAAPGSSLTLTFEVQAFAPAGSLEK